MESTDQAAVHFQNGSRFALVNPATGQDFHEIQLSTPHDVEAAVSTAHDAYGTWKDSTWDERSRILKSTAENIRNDVDGIAALLTREQGKPLKEARIEVERCADSFDLYSSDEFAPAIEQRHLAGKEALVVPRPLGVVAAIVPWNFPLTLLANKLAPALARGNSVVVKPAETTPLSTGKLLEHVASAGLPNGVTTVVLGGGEVGEALVGHRDVSMVSFTGSTAIGRAIMANASARVKRLALELGGSDALIVDASADVHGAAKAAAIGRFFNCGQACVAVKRAFVHQAVYNEFVDALAQRVDKLVIGDGRNPGVLIGPQHTEAQRERSLSFVNDATEKGAKILRGGQIPSHLTDGFFIEPTLLVDVPDNADILREESFGPILPIVKVESFDQAMQKANESDYGLGSYIWSQDPGNIKRAILEFEAGYTWVNDIGIDYDELPFGGVKQSGFGKERGRESIEEFQYLKSVVSPAGQDLI